MNTLTHMIFRGLVAMTTVLMIAKFGLAKDDIFSPQIEKSANRAIAAWIADDAADLEAALEKLTLNETYLMVIGQSSERRSYLVHVPRKLNKNFNSVAAYLFLIQKEKQGTALWPASFFEGYKFQFDQKGDR